MFSHILLTTLLLFYIVNTVHAGEYSIHITSDAPTVTGGIVNFQAKVLNYDEPAEGSFRYEWQDDGYPRNERFFDTDKPIDQFSVNYTKENHPPGPYMMRLRVSKYYLLFYNSIASTHLIFDLTETLNGELNLTQNNQLIANEFVSNNSTVIHKVTLKESDQEFLNNIATSVLTYWFVDCTFYAITNDYEYAMNYSEIDKEHTVNALVLANFDPIPIPTPPPTTTTPPTTIKPNVTTTTIAPATTTKNNTIVKGKQRRNVQENITNFSSSKSGIFTKFHGNIVSNNQSNPYNDSFPFMCSNNTIFSLGTNLTYGFFSKKIIVKQPIYDISVTGNNWIQHSDMLQLSVKCKGSSMFHYCIDFKDGLYNKTGNESCIDYDISEKCEFPISRLFVFDDSDVHTVLIIIFNDVAKVIYPVTVTVYKVNKQAQLSVIVVPVASSLVAVVLIVFGVAYYIQSRSRFTVEVADFNFGQQYGDMEYKSFRERLRDSVSNAFTRAPITGGCAEVPVWPPGRKYGSMT